MIELHRRRKRKRKERKGRSRTGGAKGRSGGSAEGGGVRGLTVYVLGDVALGVTSRRSEAAKVMRRVLT